MRTRPAPELRAHSATSQLAPGLHDAQAKRRADRFVDTIAILRGLGMRIETRPRWLAVVERMLAIDRLDAMCALAGVTRANADVRRQIRDVFSCAGIDYEVLECGAVDSGQPGSALIFYCNHPYGIADALIALDYALARRPDTKVLANEMMRAFDINAERIIWVDPDIDVTKSKANLRGLRAAMRHLKDGGALLIFPSGVCSHLQLGAGRVTDPAWTAHLARLVESTGATPVPIHFAGSNSWRFHLLGMIHPLLRTVMLVREFVGLKGRRIQARVGAPLHRAELTALGNVEARTARLRDTVYALADAPRAGQSRR